MPNPAVCVTPHAGFTTCARYCALWSLTVGKVLPFFLPLADSAESPLPFLVDPPLLDRHAASPRTLGGPEHYQVCTRPPFPT